MFHFTALLASCTASASRCSPSFILRCASSLLLGIHLAMLPHRLSVVNLQTTTLSSFLPLVLVPLVKLELDVVFLLFAFPTCLLCTSRLRASVSLRWRHLLVDLDFDLGEVPSLSQHTANSILQSSHRLSSETRSIPLPDVLSAHPFSLFAFFRCLQHLLPMHLHPE